MSTQLEQSKILPIVRVETVQIFYSESGEEFRRVIGGHTFGNQPNNLHVEPSVPLPKEVVKLGSPEPKYSTLRRTDITIEAITKLVLQGKGTSVIAKALKTSLNTIYHRLAEAKTSVDEITAAGVKSGAIKVYEVGSTVNGTNRVGKLVGK